MPFVGGWHWTIGRYFAVAVTEKADQFFAGFVVGFEGKLGCGVDAYIALAGDYVFRVVNPRGEGESGQLTKTAWPNAQILIDAVEASSVAKFARRLSHAVV